MRLPSAVPSGSDRLRRFISLAAILVVLNSPKVRNFRTLNLRCHHEIRNRSHKKFLGRNRFSTPKNATSAWFAFILPCFQATSLPPQVMPLAWFLVSQHLVLTMKTTRVRLSDIKTDVSRFQFRSVPFEEERVQWIVANWNPSLLDPLDVWESPEGKYLLAGHHRLDKPFDELTVDEWEFLKQHSADLRRQLEQAYISDNFGCYNRDVPLTNCSISSAAVGNADVNTSLPSSVTKTSFSIRMPRTSANWERRSQSTTP